MSELIKIPGYVEKKPGVCYLKEDIEPISHNEFGDAKIYSALIFARYTTPTKEEIEDKICGLAKRIISGDEEKKDNNRVFEEKDFYERCLSLEMSEKFNLGELILLSERDTDVTEKLFHGRKDLFSKKPISFFEIHYQKKILFQGGKVEPMTHDIFPIELNDRCLPDELKFCGQLLKIKPEPEFKQLLMEVFYQIRKPFQFYLMPDFSKKLRFDLAKEGIYNYHLPEIIQPHRNLPPAPTIAEIFQISEVIPSLMNNNTSGKNPDNTNIDLHYSINNRSLSDLF